MKRILRTYTHDLDAPPSRVFPLLCPVREYDWIAGWQCRMVYTQSGVAEADCVFRTAFPDEPEAVWTCSRYEPNRAIDYVVFYDGSHVQHLSIRLLELPGERTRLEWTRVFTAVTPEADEQVQVFAGTRMEAINERLKMSLQHYLATGTIWEPAPVA